MRVNIYLLDHTPAHIQSVTWHPYSMGVSLANAKRIATTLESQGERVCLLRDGKAPKKLIYETA